MTSTTRNNTLARFMWRVVFWLLILNIFIFAVIYYGSFLVGIRPIDLSGERAIERLVQKFPRHWLPEQGAFRYQIYQRPIRGGPIFFRIYPAKELAQRLEDQGVYKIIEDAPAPSHRKAPDWWYEFEGDKFILFDGGKTWIWYAPASDVVVGYVDE